MRGNLPGPEGLARRGASAALHGLPVVTTTGGAARLASAPCALSHGAGQAQLHRTDIRPCQRGSREILRQAPRHGGAKLPPRPPPLHFPPLPPPPPLSAPRTL